MKKKLKFIFIMQMLQLGFGLRSAQSMCIGQSVCLTLISYLTALLTLDLIVLLKN